MVSITLREMLQAGVHFGHRTRFWNPSMAPYIYGRHHDVHILNLEHSHSHLKDALDYVSRLGASKARLLMVGTKRAAQEPIRQAALRADLPFVDHRWLGGMLTNYKTVRQSIKRLKDLEALLESPAYRKLTKKEGLTVHRQLEKLERSLGGIKQMNGLPDAIFVVDVGYERIAVLEAKKLGIPVIGIVDTNHSPEDISYMIPGNDDSTRAIALYANAIADSYLEGKASVSTSAVVSDVKVVEKKHIIEQPAPVTAETVTTKTDGEGEV